MLYINYVFMVCHSILFIVMLFYMLYINNDVMVFHMLYINNVIMVFYMFY